MKKKKAIVFHVKKQRWSYQIMDSFMNVKNVAIGAILHLNPLILTNYENN